PLLRPRPRAPSCLGGFWEGGAHEGAAPSRSRAGRAGLRALARVGAAKGPAPPPPPPRLRHPRLAAGALRGPRPRRARPRRLPPLRAARAHARGGGGPSLDGASARVALLAHEPETARAHRALRPRLGARGGPGPAGPGARQARSSPHGPRGHRP